MTRLLSVILLALALPASADEAWTTLKGADVGAALSGHKLTYDGGATQTFAADGSTLYTSGQPSSGRWRVDGDQYCSVWPPSETWACYGLDRSADGKSLRFVAADGSATAGVYADPN